MATLTIKGVKFVCKKSKKPNQSEVTLGASDGESYTNCRKIAPDLFPLLTETGEHYWALFSGELIVVLDIGDGLYVCGWREMKIGYENVKIISKIKKPKHHKKTRAYFIPDESINDAIKATSHGFSTQHTPPKKIQRGKPR